MGKFIDFMIKHDPATETDLDLAKKILYSLIIRRLRGKKPTVLFIGGDSGEGKSYTTLTLEYILLQMQGIDLREYVDDCNVYIPIEYPHKLNRILGLEKSEKNLKKVNVLAVHEAREVVKAKLWHSFMNQAISDVNAMSRSIKRLCFIVISQFIRDISRDIRYTLTYYCTAYRPIGQNVQLNIKVIWKDDYDLESPKLRKRNIRGYIMYPSGKCRLYSPKYITLPKPPKEICEEFDKRDFESKAKMIRRKLEKLIQEMSIDIEVQNKKIYAMAEWYIKNVDQLNKIGRVVRGKWKVKPEVKIIHDLTDQEVKDFEIELNKKILEQQGIKTEGEDELNEP